MGKMNLLKANWEGKVGQTVGAKWKNISTIRTYTKPAYTNTPAQQEIRTVFGQMSEFLSKFTDGIKSYSPLDTRGMSVRNAIIKLNKEQIVAGTFDPSSLKISRGGLPPPSDFSTNSAVATAPIHCTWTQVVGSTITTKAKVIVVVVADNLPQAWVAAALNTDQEVDIDWSPTAGNDYSVYTYLLDYRGSSKVGSSTIYSEIGL